MPAPIKLKRRHKAINSLNAIFKAMQVIAAVKLKKIKECHAAALYCLKQMEAAAQHLDLAQIIPPREKGKTLAVFFSSNRGFCGAFNTNLFNRVQNFAKEQAGVFPPPEFIVFCPQGMGIFRAQKLAVKESHFEENLPFSFFGKIADEIKDSREIYIIYNRFKSLVRQETFARRIMPYAGLPFSGNASHYLLETEKEKLAREWFKQLIAVRLYYSYMSSLYGEYSARVFTLKNAIENSQELSAGLTLDLNKLRQQNITRDLLEIISSAESLKERGN